MIDLAANHFKMKYDMEYKTYDAYYNHMMFFSDLLTDAFYRNNNFIDPSPEYSPSFPHKSINNTGDVSGNVSGNVSRNESWKSLLLKCPIFTSWGSTI